MVTVLYILANIAYLNVLPLWGDAAGTDVLGRGIQHAAEDRITNDTPCNSPYACADLGIGRVASAARQGNKGRGS